MTFVIIANDFDESLLKYKSSPGFHYFVESENGCCGLTRIDWAGKTLMGEIANFSAFARYLLTNVGVDRSKINWIWKGRTPEKDNQFVGNVSADVGSQRLKDSMMAVDEFFRVLPDYSDLSEDKIQFVVDGMRPNLYSTDGMRRANGSYFESMRVYFIEQARKIGYAVIDMQPVFVDHYKENGKRFEFYPVDAHWNALGHELVADEIQSSSLFKDTFQ
jgi:hypothetical protein